MAHRISLMVLFALILSVSGTPASAQALTQPEPPEPWLAVPKYKSPRGTLQHVVPIRPAPPPRAKAAKPPPPIYVPQTGQVLPNFPTVSPSGPGGRETYQDRAARCAHQAGVYGTRAGSPSTYIGACVNQ